MPTNSSTASVCELGAGGVLTDPSNDIREWCKVYFYTDGSVVCTKAGTVDSMKTLRASGRMCVSAKYGASGLLPGYANRSDMTSVAFAADMESFNFVNMDYWFYSLSNVTSFTGLGNLGKVRELRYTFSGCTALTVLDFRGFDTSELQSLQFTFSGCTNLVTIYADATWALPASGCSGSNTFYNCNKLVGGNGTTYASSRMAYQYMRIDRSGQVGYLTAA